MPVTGPVIIIDDNKSDQGLLKSILQHLKIPNEILFFSDGKEALNYLINTKDLPFLILCDGQMPEMGGIELLQNIHKDDILKKKAIPFVFYTGGASAETIRNAYELNAKGFFIKEMEYEKMEQQLKMIIEYWKKSLREDSP
jgi:CheY-like chemotaxis protein